MRTRTGAIIPTGIILVLVCILIILITSFFEFSGLRKSEKLLTHTQDVLLESEKLLEGILNNETGSRGYLLTGDKRFLEPLEKSDSEIKAHLSALRAKTLDYPSQQRRIDSLELYLNKRVEFSLLTINVANTNGFDAAKKLVETGRGRFYTDRIRNSIDSIQGDERLKLRERKVSGEKSTAAINIILMVVLLGLLILLTLFFYRLKQESATAKTEADKKLLESDEKYRNIVEAVPEGIWLLDENNKSVFVNNQFSQMLGYDFESTREITPFDFIINSARRKQAEENVLNGLKEQFETAFISNSSKAIWISVEINPIIKNGKFSGSLVITSDISQRKRTELLLAAESRVMSKIALNEPLHHILETIVLNIEASVDGSICSILLLNDEGTKVKHGAAPHLPLEYITAIDGLAIGEGQGSCGTAAYRKQTVIVSDIGTDPLWEKYKELALKFGLKACWSTPILSQNNKVLGTFAVYYNTPQSPQKNDFEAVQRAANQSRIAIEKATAATALSESEQKYRTLVEQASDAICIAGMDGRFITVNNSAARLTQFTEEELLQKSFFDFAIAEDVEKNPFHFDELKQGKTVTTERVMKRKDGYRLNIEVTAKLLPNGQLLIFIRDISARKKAEKKIIDSEAQYRAFFENSMDGILIGNPEGAIYAANPAACLIYNKTEEQICADGRTGIAEKNDSGMLEFLEERKRMGYSRREVMQKKSNGELFPAEISSSIFKDAEGNLRTIIIVRDITERVKASNDIIREKNLSDSIINSLPGVFYMYSYDWKFIRWNKNFENRTGYTAEEIAKMHPLDFFTEGDKLNVTQKIKNVFVSGEEKTEVTVITKDGKKFPYFLTGKLIDYEGKPSLLGIGFDISDRLKAQEEVRQTNEQLRLLTDHLQQVREDERKRIAREIHDELGQQITAIKMDVAWVDKNIPDQNSSLKDKIKNIIQLLDSSNLSIRHILKELRMGVLDDYGLVEALQWLGRQFTSTTNIPVTFTSNENILKVNENIAICVFRVCQEALTNITRHANAQNVTCILKKENNHLKFYVADDGNGFDPDILKSNISFGIIGLKERVAALKGTFELETAKGKGTTIIITIPLINQ